MKGMATKKESKKKIVTKTWVARDRLNASLA
jgi:hypothetical protein